MPDDLDWLGTEQEEPAAMSSPDDEPNSAGKCPNCGSTKTFTGDLDGPVMACPDCNKYAPIPEGNMGAPDNTSDEPAPHEEAEDSEEVGKDSLHAFAAGTAGPQDVAPHVEMPKTEKVAWRGREFELLNWDRGDGYAELFREGHFSEAPNTELARVTGD